jgi:hypothetical protein
LDLQANADLLVDKLFRQEQPALWAAGAVGATVAVQRSLRAGLALTGWFLGQLLLLLSYNNLSSHLGALLVAPLAVLVGAACAEAIAVPYHSLRPTAAWLVVPLGLWYMLSVPALLERDRRLVDGELSVDRGISRTERTVVRLIGQLTDADDWVITDAPYLAFLADRKVPPALVDPSSARIDAGALTAEQAIAALETYDPDVVVLWTGKLSRLQPFTDILATNLVVVADYGPNDGDQRRLIYRDRDGDED